MSNLVVTESELGTCGPYPAGRSRVLVFTVGNDFEWHGPALPPDIDSRTIKAIAYRFTERTGTTFAAHIPYTTDLNEAGQDWCPIYMPYDEFKQKTIDYVKGIIREWSHEPERVLILVGHGGLFQFVMQTKEVEAALSVPTRVIFPAMLGSIDVELPDDFEGIDIVREIMQKGEHAYVLEHSLAAHFGFMDRDKLDELNRMAAEDPEAVLRRWPALAGLGGYIKFGGDRYDFLRKINLEFCADDFIERKKLPVSAEIGGILVEYALKMLEEIAFD